MQRYPGLGFWKYVRGGHADDTEYSSYMEYVD